MRRDKIEINLLRDEDNEAILKLSHLCPQDGIIKGYPDRSPIFRRIHQQVSPNSYHMVARRGSDLVGAFGAIFTNLQYKGQKFDSAYLLDLKVHPDYRRSTVAYRVVKETVDHLRRNGTTMAIASFLKDNEYSLIFTKNRAGIQQAKYLGDLRIFSIIPLFPARVSKRFAISQPTQSDLPELVELYNQYYSSFKLAPCMTMELLEYYTTEIDGMDLNQFWVARSDGKIRAVICAWDEDHYKRWFVNRMSRMMAFLSFLLRLFGLALKMPAPLRQDKAIKHISLVLAAHDGSLDAMKDLFRTVNNFYRGKEYTILQAHFNAEDPANSSLKGLLGFNVHAEAHMFTEDPTISKTIAEDEGLVHFEWPMYL